MHAHTPLSAFCGFIPTDSQFACNCSSFPPINYLQFNKSPYLIATSKQKISKNRNKKKIMGV